MDSGRKQYTFLWFIENYSYCWHETGNKLVSPEFTPDGMETTVWTLSLYPRGETEKSRDHIAVYLRRSESDGGPPDVRLTFELSFLAADGSKLCKMLSTDQSFTKKLGLGTLNFAAQGEILSSRKAEYLSQDTLIVCCKMWNGGGQTREFAPICARTRIGIEKLTFLHVVKSFSSLQPNQRRSLRMQSKSSRKCVVSSTLYNSECECCEGRIAVEISASEPRHVLSKCDVSLIGVSAKITKCGEVDSLCEGTRKDIRKVPLSLSKDAIVKKESEYLIDGTLSLLCECTFSTGLEFEKIEGVEQMRSSTAARLTATICNLQFFFYLVIVFAINLYFFQFW